MRRLVVSATALLLVGCAPALTAPPQLIASWPEPGAKLSVGRHVLELTFNRALDPTATWVSVWGDDGSTLGTTLEVDEGNHRRLKVQLEQPSAGTYDLHWHAVDAESHLVKDGDQPFSLQNESPAPPRIDVSPGEIGNREPVELVGKGFAATSPLELTIGDNAAPLATTQTDDHGKFNVEARAPDSVPYGVQPITAVDGEGRRATSSVFLKGGGWPPVVATDVGQPGPLADEVTFSVSVRNVSDYVLEHVAVTLADPDRAEFVGGDGAFERRGTDVVWLVPELERGQRGPFRATYRVTGSVVSHSWVEFRRRKQRGCARSDCIPAFISVSVADSAPTGP